MGFISLKVTKHKKQTMAYVRPKVTGDRQIEGDREQMNGAKTSEVKPLNSEKQDLAAGGEMRASKG